MSHDAHAHDRPSRWADFRDRIRYLTVADHAPVVLPWHAYARDDSPVAILHRAAAEPRQAWAKIALGALWPAVAFSNTLAAVQDAGETIRELGGPGVGGQFVRAYWMALRHNVTAASFYKYRLWKPDLGKTAGDYIQHHEIVRLLRELNHPYGTRHERDKVVFFEQCQRHGIPTPPVFAVAGEGRLDWRAADGRLPRVDLFVKPSDRWCGMGAARWNHDSATDRWSHGERSLSESELLDVMRNDPGTLVVQPALENAPEVTGFGPNAVCTLRVVTFRPPGGSASLAVSVWRMPVGASEVDNFAAGGLASAVRDGVLGPGRSKDPLLPDFDQHPTTGEPITGAALPRWHDLVALAVRAHDAFELPPTVGWDVALTTDGPKIIESNGTWCTEVVQIAYGQSLTELGVVDAYLTAKQAGEP